MVATLIKEEEIAVVAVAEQKRLVSENSLVLRNTADVIKGLIPAEMDSVYGKVLEDMVYP